MKTLKLIIITLCAITLAGCSDGPTDTAPQRTVPEPTLVTSADIPSGASATLYRGIGSALVESPVPVTVLQNILDAGYDLRRAWHPQVSICGAITLDELILQLGSPDVRIINLGFFPDTLSSHEGCTTGWDEYDFSDATRSEGAK